MKLDDAGRDVLQVVESAAFELDEARRKEVSRAVVDAMKRAATACCLETDSIVAERLKDDPTLVARINQEAEMRRKVLISNLTSAW